MLSEQQKAPDFSAVNQLNESISLKSFQGKKNVVIYFYPKDDTPGCTIEANQFTEYVDEFNNLDTVILGVSKDTCDSHKDFITKYKIQFDLLADIEGELCQLYGAWQEKEKAGVKKMGIVRSTFIINKDGLLINVEYGVTAEGHAKKVLDILKSV